MPGQNHSDQPDPGSFRQCDDSLGPGLGFTGGIIGVQDLGVQDLGLRVAGFRVTGFRVAGFRVTGFRVTGFSLGLQG